MDDNLFRYRCQRSECVPHLDKTEAATKGTIAGKKISAAEQAYAIQILKAMKAGAKVENTVMQINIPPTNQNGVPTAVISNWP